MNSSVYRFVFISICLALFCTLPQVYAAQLLVRTPVLAPKVAFNAATQAWLSRQPSIKVAYWGDARPPLHMGFEPNKFEGATADVLGLLQQILGVEFELVRFTDRAHALQAMGQGDVDMLALNQVTDVDPVTVGTRPYLLNHKVVVRRIREPFTQSKNLSGERLAFVAQHPDQGDQLRRSYGDSDLVPYTNHLNALAGLAYDQTDAFITNAITAEFLISRFYRNQVYIAGKAAEPNQADVNFAVSVRAPHLLTAVNQALAAIPVAGMLRITSRWGLSNNVVTARPSLELSPEQVAWIKSHPKVRVFVVGSDAPLTFFDEGGRLQGLSADLLKLIERRTGLEFELVRSTGVVDMVARMQKQQVDFAVALNIAESRFGLQQYTRPYLISPFVVVTRRARAGIRSLDELDNATLALPVGHPLSAWISKHYPTIKQVPVENATRGLEMLMAGEVDSTVHTQFGADYFIKHHFQHDLHIASVIGPTPARVAMAVTSGNHILKSILNGALLGIPPEELKEMTDRWRHHVTPSVANSWSSYKEVVYTVILCAGLFVLISMAWNYLLRRQVRHRRKAEQALADQLSFSRTLIDGAPVALFVRDTQARLVHCNQAYLDFLHTSREAVLDKTLLESNHVSPEINSHYHHTYLQIVERGLPVCADLEIHVQGRCFQIYHWVMPFHNGVGQCQGVIGGWLDITDRVQLTEQLRLATQSALQANRSKTTFLTSMSHEIRTPVSALIGLIELLKVRGGSARQMKDGLEVAYQSAQSLLSLIGDILDLSKIEAGAMAPLPRPTHLIALMESVHKLFESNARKKHLDYRLVIEVEHPGVMVDALMLKQIVSNLLSNAIKFTDQGSIMVLLRELPADHECSHGRFAIQVSDTGIGLDELQIAAIFEPFVQTEPLLQRSGGSGLGLNICNNLAKLIGAQLSVDSQPQLGSRFTLVFEAPLEDVDQVHTLVEPQTTPSHRLKVLVVEDHAPNRLLLCQQLEYLGHEAVPCENGEAAFAVWLSACATFDVTITDCCLPLLDGWALTQRMREYEQQAALRAHPILGLTAHAQAGVIDQCLAAGMNRCLLKPLGIEVLAALMEEVAQQSERRAQAACSTEGGELQKIKLLSPNSYGSIVDQALKTLREDALMLTKLIDAANLTGLAKLAHKIRGGALIAGDRTLMDACENFESMIARRQTNQWRASVLVIQQGLQLLEERLLRER